MMLPAQFEAYCSRLTITDLGRQYLRAVREGASGKPAAPSRSVESHVGNLVIRYPSGKNGKVLSCESRRIEFAQALLLENDDNVVEFFTQPPPIELRYKSAKGRDVRCDITPDFLVLRRAHVEWVDGKPADKMPELVADRPGRYAKEGENLWRCPPGDVTSRSYGFCYRVWTDAEFSREIIRNLKHLDPFLKLGADHYAELVWRPVQEFVLRRPGISVEELGASGVDGQKLVRWMLARRLIYCDFDKYLLAEPARARLYPTRSVAVAAEILRTPEPIWPSVLGVSPSVQPASVTHMTAALLRHGAEVFAEANQRWSILQGFVPREKWDVTRRTVRRWKVAVAKAEQTLGMGNGYLGLLTKVADQGNFKPRLDSLVVQLAEKNIRDHYLNPPAKTGATVYKMFRSECQEKHPTVRIPSDVWFYSRLKLLEKGKVERAQRGERAAYPYKFSEKGLLGMWDAHGDYPFMNVHADHTQLDVWVRSARTGQTLGKPWMTVLIDSTSRAVLAIYLSLDGPSIDSVMMVVRDCVWRHSRLPMGLVVDNGSEFRSVWFQTFTASNGIIVTQRPPHQAKFGNPIENFFGVQNVEFIHQLEGNNLILQTPRLTTKSVDPRRHAVWTLAELYKALEWYCFDHFNQRVHVALGQSPAEVLKALMEKHGIDRLPETKFDDAFLLLTMLEARNGGVRVQRPCGLKVLGDYFHNLQLAGFIGQNLPVRWDPMDPARVLAKLPEGWIPCVSQYAKEVSGMSVRDVQFFAQELRQRHSATARDRIGKDTELGSRMRYIKETKEPELRRRLECAAANREVTSNHFDSRVTLSPFNPVSPLVGSAAALEEREVSSDTTQDASSSTEEFKSRRPRPPTRKKAIDLL